MKAQVLIPGDQPSMISRCSVSLCGKAKNGNSLSSRIKSFRIILEVFSGHCAPRVNCSHINSYVAQQIDQT